MKAFVICLTGCALLILLAASPAAGASTAVHIVRIAADGDTVLNETTVDYLWMEANLPVYGDGVTHYYHQGPVFIDDPDPEVEAQLRWNPDEDTNILEKDMGAVKGTNVKDLCDLVGGMSAGEEAKFRASDGWSKYIAYDNIYEYSAREGPIVLTWWRPDLGYVSEAYSEGMRMVWFADTSTNPFGEHAFGVWDWHEAAGEPYWYYYYSGGEKYPTTTGLSGMYISDITIYSDDDPAGSISVTSDPEGAAILLDGEETGEATNATLTGIFPGEYSVQVALGGYRLPDEITIEVENGKTAAVHFDLEPLTGSIEVTSDPDGASIVIDGVERAEKTDALLEYIPVGTHIVFVRMDGHSSVEERVEVAEDETTGIAFTLEPVAIGTDGASDSSGYTGKNLSLYEKGTLNGTLEFLAAPGYADMLESGDTRRYTITAGIRENAAVERARLYVYLTKSRDEITKTAQNPEMRVVFGESPVNSDSVYTDTIDTVFEDYILQTSCFDVTKLLSASGEYDIAVTNTGGTDDIFSLYGVGLILLTRCEEQPPISYWILEGCDCVCADLSGTPPATTADFSGTIDLATVTGSRLIVVSATRSDTAEPDHRVTFNEGEWFGLFPAGKNDITAPVIDVRLYLHSSENTAEIQSSQSGSDGTYLENRNAVLILNHTSLPAPQLSAATPSILLEGVPEGGTVAGNRTIGEYLLPAPGAVPNTTRISLPGTGWDLIVREGTCLTPAGERITFEQIAGDTANGTCSGTAYRIGPEGLQSSLPMVLVAPDTCPSAGTLAVFDAENGTWMHAGCRTDPPGARLCCEVGESGTYAVVPLPSETGTETTGEGNSLISFILGILGKILERIMPANPSLPCWCEIPGTILVNATFTAIAGNETPEGNLSADNSPPSLSITSNPSNALIYLNGSYTGLTTPATLDGICPGEHLIRIRRDGFTAWEEPVAVVGNEKISVELFPENGPALKKLKFGDNIAGIAAAPVGNMYVTSVPDGATIYVDGKKTALKTNTVVSGLREGKHTIRIDRGETNFPASTQSVWIYEGGITGLGFNQAPHIEWTAAITSEEYAGDDFSVNGVFPAYTIPRNVTIAGGSRYITIVHNGTYISRSLSAYEEMPDIRPDDEPPVPVTVTSIPEGSAIFIDGFPVGYCTPFTFTSLSPGIHRISVSKPGDLPGDREVLIAAGRQDEVKFILEPYFYGSVAVTSDPPGAKIYLYNRYTGAETPAVFTYMDIGSYDFKLVGDDATEEIDEIVVMPFEVTWLNVTLTGENT
ncbi:MAG: PEGA domain-containing protein [Methanomicrobiaceae archaeon]|nr:PEGA domain-containing protein [Methanomicrobiaceae archaeon]